MAVTYSFDALTESGEKTTGTLVATSTDQVEAYLADRRMQPIRIRTQRRQLAFRLPWQRRYDYDKLILFTNSLATMTRAGVPLLRSLEIIRVGPADGPFNTAIDQVHAAVHSGKTLSEAMIDQSGVFPPVFTASIAAGEESGRLDQTLEELASMLEEELEIQRMVKSAIRYPMIVIGVLAAAFLVVMTFVVPRFVAFYANFDAELPLPTQIMIGTSTLLQQYWYLILAGAGILGFGFQQWRATATGRRMWDGFLLKIPVIGDLIIKGNIARFSILFRILFRAGLPLVKTLAVLRGTIRNSAVANEVTMMEEMFQRGQSLDKELGRFRLFPVQSLHMMAVGLESGNLDTMLYEIGRHYAKQVAYTSRHLNAIIEPILTLCLGVFVLILALAIFLPMWNLVKVFGQ